MNNRIKYVFCCLFFIFSKSILAQQNTILIIADDLSPDYLGCFSNTTDTAVSPNIRALAERGITFPKFGLHRFVHQQEQEFLLVTILFEQA